MALASLHERRNRRFHLRATPSEETLIKVAVERQGISVMDFITRGAREKTEQALSDQTRFVMEHKQWKAFLTALDRPSRDKGSLIPNLY